MELNGNKCSEGMQYPECHCNECLDNIIECDGVHAGTDYMLDGHRVRVLNFCPLPNTGGIWFNNIGTPLDNGNGPRYGWTTADKLQTIDA